MFSRLTYIDRRQKLKLQFSSGILLFLGNEESPVNYTDNCYPFRQDSSFLYFFGIDKPGLTVVIDIDKDEEIIFGDDLAIDDVVWTGPQPELSDQAAEVGIQKIRSKDSVPSFLSTRQKIHFLPPYRPLNRMMLSEWLNIPIGEVNSRASAELIKAVIDLRSIKSKEEISEMEDAVDISRKLHQKANEMARSGVTEARILAVLTEITLDHNSRFSYNPIITKNGQTLHNTTYRGTLKRGDLLLVDAGVENAAHYAGDITRTFAVDGVFDSRQKEIYNIVLKAEVESISKCKPGIVYDEIHHHAMTILADGLTHLGIMKGDPEEAVEAGAHALFCPHGIGHMIGLDVHDMEDLGEDLVGYDDEVKRSGQFGTKALRFGRRLHEGFSMTVEPGIYFIPDLINMWKAESKFEQFINYDHLDGYLDFGGIRIEDNIVIEPDGARILGKPIPKNLNDIQS